MKTRLILFGLGWRLTQVALPALFVIAALALNTTASAQAPPGSLWYNGDYNRVDALPNGRNTNIPQAAVYDDFDVTAPQGWNVTAVFSDNLLNPFITVTGADWEIRTGVSEGNAGTLVASGTTDSPVVTFTGRGGLGLPEFMVEVTGLNVFLPMLPSGQHYWLNVTPVGNGMGTSANTTTDGFHCVGMPCGNDQNAFFNSTTFGVYFASTANEGQPYDYSNGVIGTAVPEPKTAALVTWGMVLVLIVVRPRRGRDQGMIGEKYTKPKMNFARICWRLLTFVICLSSSPQSRGVTLDVEQAMGAGFEPVVNCDRRVSSGDADKRIQLVWVDTNNQVYRYVSHQLGVASSWIVGVPLGTSTHATLDPFAACDLWSTDATAPRTMYLGGSRNMAAIPMVLISSGA